MAQIQYQEQEDLTAELDVLSWKEENKCSIQDEHCGYRNVTSSKGVVRRSRFKMNFMKKTETNKSVRNTTYLNESPSEICENKTKTVLEEEDADWGFHHCLDEFSSESFNVLLKFFTENVEGIVDTMAEGLLQVYSVLVESLREVPRYEEELKYVSCISLICYGGSWTTLAGIVAAAEAFETELVLEEVHEVGTLFFSDDVDLEVSPAEIKENVKKLGLHIALMIAVLVSSSWAELCITIALASKIAQFVPVVGMLKKVMMIADTDIGEMDDLYRLVDEDWFDLLALIACNIVSLIVFACFQQFTTAMYMGYHGVSVLVESLTYLPLFWEFEMINRTFWMKNTTQFLVWGFVVIMSLWQAISGYTGVCLFVSWLMFLHPLVQVYNMFTTDSDNEETENLKVE